jgi:hypothetical protein
VQLDHRFVHAINLRRAYPSQVLAPTSLLAAWGNAVLRGDASPDLAAEVLQRCAAGGAVLMSDGVDGEAVTLPVLLARWAAGSIPGLRLLLPRAGDPAPRLGGAADAAVAAAGAAVAVIGDGPALLHVAAGAQRGWRALAVAPGSVPPPAPVTLAEADRAVRAAIRQAEPVLLALQTPDAPPEVIAELQRLRHVSPAPLPDGHPAPAVALLAQSQRLRPVLALAAGLDPTVTGLANRQRRGVLADLDDALRRAECVAVDAGIPAPGPKGGRR